MPSLDITCHKDNLPVKKSLAMKNSDLYLLEKEVHGLKKLLKILEKGLG